MSPKPQLSLLKKREMAQHIQKGMKENELVVKYDTSKVTVNRVKQYMNRLLHMEKEGLARRKRIKSTKYEELENALLVWIRKAREQNCILTGSIIQIAAVRIAQERGMDEPNFKASNGWFENFKERHQIVSKALQGERTDAPVE